MSVAALLEGEMRRRGWNQAELARRLGARQQSVSRWMDEQNPTRPSVEACYQIAERLEVDPQTVLQLAGLAPPERAISAEADLQWELTQRELRAIYESYERSKWADLTRTFEGVANLAHATPPAPAPEPGPTTEQEARRRSRRVRRNPEEHQGNAEGRDNVNTRDLAWLTTRPVKLLSSPVLV